MAAPPEESEERQPTILAHGLTREYVLGKTQVIGIDRIDLNIGPGERVVLKGNSGSGKSTLLSLFAGLDRPTGGKLSVAGYDLNQTSDEDLTFFRREVVGMIFQSFNLMPTLSVLENAVLPALLAGKPLKKSEEKAKELLNWLSMDARIHHFPSALSGGEMQRTAIARALINDPELVLADEPTGNLDSKNGEAVIALMSELNRVHHCTVVMATHSTLADTIATRMIVLKDGKVVSSS